MAAGSLVKNANKKLTKLVEGSADRLRKARKNASYKADDFAKDVVAFWGDVVDAWLGLVPWPGSPAFPTCVVRLAKNAKSTGSAYLTDDVDPTLVVVTVTDLKDAGGGAAVISAARITSKKIVDGDQIEIELDLTGGGPYTAGAYQGLAYDATAPQPLATILALVT
jgi:hypothetical protein